MERRKFIERVCAATVVTSGGIAGCVSFGNGGTEIGGSDGGDGSGGDGGSDGGDGSDGGGGGGSDGGGGDGGMTETSTPTATPTATMAQQTISGGAQAPYDNWASQTTYPSEAVQAFSVQAGTGTSTPTGPTPTPTPTPQGTEAPIDPILGYPTTYLLAALFSGFALTEFNLGQIASEDGGTEWIHSPGKGLVFEGSFDTGALRSKIGESEASESGSYEGYTLYASGSGENSAVLGLSSEALVHASADERVSDPQAVVESTIDAGLGNATPYGDEYGAYADLVTALPTKQVMGVSFSPSGGMNEGTPTPTPTPTPSAGGSSGSFFEIRDFDLEGTVRGFATALGYGQNQESATARMAIRYASPGEIDDSGVIKSQAAPRASDVSLATSGSLVVVTATYTEESNS